MRKEDNEVASIVGILAVATAEDMGEQKRSAECQGKIGRLGSLYERGSSRKGEGNPGMAQKGEEKHGKVWGQVELRFMKAKAGQTIWK